MIPSNACLLEMRQLNFLAKDYLAKGDASKAKELRDRAEGLGNIGLSSDELRLKYTTALFQETRQKSLREVKSSPEYRNAFHRYLASGDEKELRDLTAGTSSLTYTQGPSGGISVPVEYEDKMWESNAQADPLIDPKIVDVVRSDTPYQLAPHQLSGVDVSTVAAQNVAEINQQQPQATPNVSGRLLRGNIGYRYAQAESWEADMDIPDIIGKYMEIAGIALARQLGADAAVGNGGTNVPAGLFPFLGPSVATVGTGSAPVGGQSPPNITYADLNGVYFKVNRIYRAQPKCAWLCSDQVYQRIRNAADNFGRPLLDMERDGEVLLGKPLYVSPSLSNAFTSEGFGALIFGDLSAFHVRLSAPSFGREFNRGVGSWQRIAQGGVGDITKGQYLLVTRVKMDSSYFDPQFGGPNPPVVWAQVRSS
jgi:HK97 family phage major capsid protein